MPYYNDTRGPLAQRQAAGGRRPLPIQSPAANAKDYGGTGNTPLDEYLNHHMNLHGGVTYPHTGTFVNGPGKHMTPGQYREKKMADWNRGDRSTAPAGSMATMADSFAQLKAGSDARKSAEAERIASKNRPLVPPSPAVASPAPAQTAQPNAAQSAVGAASTAAASMAGGAPGAAAMLANTQQAAPAPKPIASPAAPDASMIPGAMPTGAQAGTGPGGMRTISGPYGSGYSRPASQTPEASSSLAGTPLAKPVGAVAAAARPQRTGDAFDDGADMQAEAKPAPEPNAVTRARGDLAAAQFIEPNGKGDPYDSRVEDRANEAGMANFKAKRKNLARAMNPALVNAQDELASASVAPSDRESTPADFKRFRTARAKLSAMNPAESDPSEPENDGDPDDVRARTTQR